jgi:O-acetylhomoserine/O-acetylserine sulfhydrylase-like pyridoxal-dependent enzyme
VDKALDELDVVPLGDEGQSLLCGSAREGLSPLVALADRMGCEQWRTVSDVAQVVAYYLRCHPRVEVVRYPGVKGDPWFEEASHTLVGGFGPLVVFRVAGEWYQLTCTAADPHDVVMSLEHRLAQPTD